MLIDARFDKENIQFLKKYLSSEASPIEFSITRMASNKVYKLLIRQYVKLFRRLSIKSIDSLEFKVKFKVLIYFGKSLFRSVGIL